MSKTTAPKISIGLPVWNGERYLAEAIESLLAQSFPDFELIISDNCSSDRTADICAFFASRDPRVRIHRNERNIGAARNFNNVVGLARGTFFVWGNHDDRWDPAYLERCLDALQADSDVVLAYTGAFLIDDHGEVFAEPMVGLGLDAKVAWKRLRTFHDLLLDIEHDPERYRDVSEGLWIPVYGLLRTETLRKTAMIGNFVSSDTVLIEELLMRGRFVEIRERLFDKRDHSDRSMREFLSIDKRIEWFTGKKRPLLMFPQWRLFGERLAAVWRAASDVPSTLRCTAEVFRFMRQRRGMLLWDEIWRKVKRAFTFAGRGRRGCVPD